MQQTEGEQRMCTLYGFTFGSFNCALQLIATTTTIVMQKGKYTKCAMTLAQVKPIRSDQQHKHKPKHTHTHTSSHISNYF